jgi:hypothetical protein
LANLFGWLANNAGPLILIFGLLTIGMAGGVVWLALRLQGVEKRYHALTVGSDAGNLHALLEGHICELRKASGQMEALQSSVQRLEWSNRRHLQHLGFLRYNPFRTTGGDQSFVLALADAEGNGAVLTSLYNRDSTRIYAKPLAAWQSPYPLTEEEEQAIGQAKAKG